MLKFQEIPDIENGFLLEPKKGWFGVVVPTEKQNLIINPSFTGFPNKPSNITYSSATVFLNTLGNLFEPTSLGVYPSGTGTSVLTYQSGLPLSGQYTFSFYIAGIGQSGQATLRFDNQFKTFDIRNNEYIRVFYTGTLPDNGVPKNFGITTTVRYQVTAMQLEEGTLTTYFSGNTPTEEYDVKNGYAWLGEPYNSVSIRKSGVYSGGEIISLYELGFNVTAVEGIGFPDLSPILFEQALNNKRIYSFSNIAARDVVIDGVITSKNFGSLVTKRYDIGSLIHKTDKPVRIYFTPYEHCDQDDVSCMYFDFLYQSGLNDEFDSWFGQEVSLSGTTLDPCLNKCIPYTYNTTFFSDMVVEASGNAFFFINEDGTVEDANMPNFTSSPTHSRLIDATESNGILYALIEQKNGSVTNHHFVKYSSGTWTKIATTIIESQSIPLTPNATLGNMLTVCAAATPFGGIYVGGYWDTVTTAVGISNTGTPPAQRWSMFRYDPDTNFIHHYQMEQTDHGDGIGQVNDIHYDPDTGVLYVCGVFDRFLDPDTSIQYVVDQLFAFTSINYPTTYVTPIDIAGVGNGGSNGGVTIADDNKTQPKKLFTKNKTLYVLGNMVKFGYNAINSTPAYLLKYDTSRLNTVSGSYSAIALSVETSYPFASNTGTNISDGALIDIYPYGNNFFLTGRFEQAVSDFNTSDQSYDATKDYLANVAWLDPIGYNKRRQAFMGRLNPLVQTLEQINADTVGTDHAYGIYSNTTADASPLSNANGAYAEITELDGLILFYGNIKGYGHSEYKASANGVAAYLPLSETNLSNGLFVPPPLILEGNTTSIPKLVKLDNVPNKKMLVGNNMFGTDSDFTFIYNTGIPVNTCRSDIPTDAEIIIIGNYGVYGITAIKNLTSGKEIYFKEFDAPSGSITTISYKDQSLYVTRSGYNQFYTSNYYQNGNPLSVKDGDVIQIVFNLSETQSIAGFNNPTFSIRTKECYLSYDEVINCE